MILNLSISCLLLLGVLGLQRLSPAVANTAHLAERFSYYSSKLQNVSKTPYSTTAYTSCDYVDVCEYDLDKIVWTNDSDIFPPFQVNTSLVAHKLVAGANPANEINEICSANNMNDEWEDELRTDQYGALAWQYLGFSTEGTYSYFPMSNWSDANACPGTYDPRSRAWYLSAISGPLNVMIMIDVTKTDFPSHDNLRLSRQKEAAMDVLRSLNYWSFFNIVFYTESTSFFSQNVMLRATADNLGRAKDLIESTTISTTSEYVAFENALDRSLSLMQFSDTVGAESSLCHSVVIVLASDRNDISSATDIDTIIDTYPFENGNLVILPFVFNFQSYVVDPIYEEASCHTGGFHREFTDSAVENSAGLVVSLYSSFLASTLEINSVRYSEIYIDALGLGEMTTGAIPLYKDVTDGSGVVMREVVGVYGIDLLVTGLNDGGAISNNDIMASLAALSSCPDMVVTDDILLSFREGRTCELALDTTSYVSNGEHGLEQNKWKYDLLGSFGLIGSLTICLVIIALLKNDNSNVKLGGAFCVILLHITFGIALVAYCLSTTWDEAVQHKYWEEAEMTVLSAVIDPSTCCNVGNCQCSNYGGDTCASLVDSYLEGYCDNGYFCCRSEEYDCNCSTDSDGHRSCQTCTRCITSVNHRLCEVTCQECYTGIVLWKYHPEESDTPIIKEYSQYCNKGTEAASLACAEDFVDDYSVGSVHTILYNPLNLLETSEDLTPLPAAYRIIIYLLTAGLSISYAVVCGVFCMSKTKSSKYSTKEAQATADPAKDIQMQQPVQYVQVPVPAAPAQYQQQVQQPQYVQQQQPQYGQQQPPYGQQQPPYAQQQPQYAQQQPQYAQQQPQYAQAPGGHAPPPQYSQGAPTSSKYYEEDAPPPPPPPPAY